MQSPLPLQPMASAPQVEAIDAGVHALCGSLPDGFTAPQVPLPPPPLSAAVHAMQPPHAWLQQTPSAQMPFPQSVFAPHFWPWLQRVAHAIALPPQSTSVSDPFCAPLQFSMPPQPSGKVPQVLPSDAQVDGAQVQFGAVHLPLVVPLAWH